MAEIAPIVPVILIIALIIAEPVSVHLEKNEKFTLSVSLAIFALSFSSGGSNKKRRAKKSKKRRALPVRILPSITRAAGFLFGKARVRVNALNYQVSSEDFAAATLMRARFLSFFSAVVAFVEANTKELMLADDVPDFSCAKGGTAPKISFDITVDFLLVYVPTALILFLIDILKRGARLSVRR